MKTLLLYTGFLLMSISSKAQFDRLTIDFHPSFIDYSKLTIQNIPNGYKVTLQTTDLKEEFLSSNTLLNDLGKFFKDYNFVHKNSIDSVKQEKITENGDTVVYYQITMGMDGINVYGELVKEDKLKTFKFWSPRKKDINHELITILFEIMYKQFNNQRTISYLEQLEQYFDFGLGLRKLHDNPLTYKLYGSISKNEVEELHQFFDSLPVDKKVYIDMSNFNGMGTMFDDDFLDLSESHKLITWINCSDNAKKTLKRAMISKIRYN